MGRVFLAQHTKLGREVALKILAGHRLADPRMRERFAAEMRAVGKLSHPNIMLNREGEVKLLDLGLARFQTDGIEPRDSGTGGMTGTGQAMGTADYMAPEQVTDSRSVDVRADLYSLGCTLYKLLTGNPPFAGNEYSTAFAKMTAHVSARPPGLAKRLPGAPAGLVKLITRAGGEVIEP